MQNSEASLDKEDSQTEAGVREDNSAVDKPEQEPVQEQEQTPANSEPALEIQLEKALAALQEKEDAYLRARAETENTRRRAQEDMKKAHKFASEQFASELLPVRDSMEAALEDASADIKALREGVELTLRQLNTAFERCQLVELNPLESKFDPNYHQAISQQEDEGEPGRVLQVLQKGYRLHERVLRPALVIVSKKPTA